MLKNLFKLLGMFMGLTGFVYAPNAFALNVSIFTSTDSNSNLGVIPTTTNAQSSLDAFIGSTSANTLDFETAATGSGASFSGGTLTTINGITFSTNATLTGGTPTSGITNTNSTGAAVGFGTTGTYGTGTFARLDPADTNTFTFNFNLPVSQFGFIITDFGNTPAGNNAITFGFSDALSASLTISAGITQFGNASANVANNSRNARFFGVQSTDGTAIISQAIFTIARPSGGQERFGIDDIRINTQPTQPIPFEFESATGLILIGGYFVGKRYLKNRKA